jgi:serine/threonine protein kinase/tetratricopeptide (TPR) repeat protein
MPVLLDSEPLPSDFWKFLTPPGPVGLTEDRLAPRSLLAERYQIVRYLARGGMGEVYEALDLGLKEAVALKVVRPGLATDRTIMERFRREIQLSRRVTHPNVCRMFDLGHHRDERQDVTFLTMELLAGETLEQRLARDGRIPVEVALPLVRQMADALDAAHAVGVIHRDFKSSNVLLVPGPAGVRAVVTDFGLARSLEKSSETTGMSSSGDVVGTAAYMAPEQARGSEASQASDIYSLGVVIYEMVTGARPHSGGSPIELLVNRLSERPLAPRMRNPDLPQRWERVILRCLEREPSDRFASARDVVRALEDETPLAQELPRSRPRLRRPALGWVAAILAGVIFAAAAGARYLGKDIFPHAHPSRRSVAVLGFKDLGGRPDTGWLSTALTEMFSAELSAGAVLRTVPSENVNRMKAELGLRESETYSKETLARIRENLNVDVVVLGSYLALDAGTASPLRVDVSVQDTASGETLATVTDRRSIATLFDLVLDAGNQLRGRLGAGVTSEAQSRSVRASIPGDPRAARLYAEGLTSLGRFDLLRARDLFRQSLEIEPGHALTHSALAETLGELGVENEAEAEARKALDAATSQAREDRLLIEGRLHEASHEWDKAIETYRILFGFFPDDVGHGLRLVRAQTRAVETKAAMETIASLRALPAPASSDPRIDLAEAEVADIQGDFGRSQAVAEETTRKGKVRRARLLVAAGLLKQARAQLLLGQYSRSSQLAEEARAMYRDVGDVSGALSANEATAIANFALGRLEEALKLYSEGVQEARRISTRNHESRNLAGLGDTYLQRGDLDDAQRSYEDSLDVATAVGDKHMVTVSLANTAAVLMERGKLPAARERYERCLTLARKMDNRWMAAGVTIYLSDLERKAGNLAAARVHGERAVETLKVMGDGFYRAWALYSMGELAYSEGALSIARAQQLASIELRKRTGDRVGLATSQVALSAVALEEGRTIEAESYAKAAGDQFRAVASRDGEATALQALARIHLTMGRKSDAQREAKAASVLVAKSGRPSLRLSVATTGALVTLASGDSMTARDRLAEIASEVDAAGFELVRLEALLALAEAERAAGDDSSAQRRLSELENDARKKGFGLIAQKAAALARIPHPGQR